MQAKGEPDEGVTEYLYKILVVGDIGTGKTSIIKRFVHNIFSMHYKSTIGVDFALKVINWDPKTEVRLQLWDIAGQERFGNMTRVYYKEAVGAFIVFDMTRLSTFEAVTQWKADIDAKVTWGPENRPIPVVLLANKCDLAREGFCKTTAEMNAYCQEHGFIGWFETSAKDNKNIDKAAKFLVGLHVSQSLNIGQEPGERAFFTLHFYILEHDDRRNVAPDPDIIVPSLERPTAEKKEGCRPCS